jgi:hypothetical protein
VTGRRRPVAGTALSVGAHVHVDDGHGWCLRCQESLAWLAAEDAARRARTARSVLPDLDYADYLAALAASEPPAEDEPPPEDDP